MLSSRRAVLAAGAASAATLLTGCATDGARATRTLVRYGGDPAQVAELQVPARGARRVVVLVHGGYWRAGPDRHQFDAVAADLLAAGWATYNLEYRGTGGGGGYPATFADVASGADRLVDVAAAHGLALDRTVVVGHSAGGTLALWLAARHRLPAGAVGAAPRLRVDAAASLAGVDELASAYRRWRLGGTAITDLLGGTPDAVPERYARTDPAALLPVGVPLLVAHGERDRVVPVQLSRDYAAAAVAAGDAVRLVVLQGLDHGAFLQPTSAAWGAVRRWLGTEAAA